MASKNSCKFNPDDFCYICASYVLKAQRCKLSTVVKDAYRLYFGISIDNDDKPWAPSGCCATCSNRLRDWYYGKPQRPSFYVSPTIWRKPANHTRGCYFCRVKTKGCVVKSSKSLIYPSSVKSIDKAVKQPKYKNIPVQAIQKSLPQSIDGESAEVSIANTADDSNDYDVTVFGERTLYGSMRARGMIRQPRSRSQSFQGSIPAVRLAP